MTTALCNTVQSPSPVSIPLILYLQTSIHKFVQSPSYLPYHYLFQNEQNTTSHLLLRVLCLNQVP